MFKWMYGTPQFQNYIGNPDNAKQSPFGALLSGSGGGLGLGLGALSSLFSFLGGGQQRSQKKQIFGQLGNIAGQVGGMRGRLNPADLYAKEVAGFRPQQQQFGQQFDKRFGFDSGQSAGHLATLMAQRFGGLRPQLEQQSANFDLETLLKQAQIRQAQGGFI